MKRAALTGLLVLILQAPQVMLLAELCYEVRWDLANSTGKLRKRMTGPKSCTDTCRLQKVDAEACIEISKTSFTCFDLKLCSVSSW